MTLVVALSACGSPTEPQSCSNLAPLHGQFNSATPGFIVVFWEGTDAQEATLSLERKYGFTATGIFQVLPGFAADVTTETITRIRCEPIVKFVEYNAPFLPAADRSSERSPDPRLQRTAVRAPLSGSGWAVFPGDEG